MPDTSTDRAIGRLEGRLDEVGKKLDSLIRTVEAQNETASEARRRLYDRVGAVETSIEISGQIDAQVRDRIDGIDKRLSEDVMPTVSEVKRWKVTGMTLLAVAGVAGASIGAAIFWLWEMVVERVRGWFV